MAFEAKEKTVDRLLNDAIYCIPRNQRRYVWNSQNWLDLFEDLELVVDKISKTHFIGSIVLKDEGREEGLQKFTVIDGQQRIITLTTFLLAIMFAFKQRGMTDDFGGTRKYIVAKNIKNNWKEIVDLEYHLSLSKLTNNILDKTDEEISKLSVAAIINISTLSDNKDKSIMSAFRFFSSKIASLSDEKLIEFRDALINVSYVNIVSSTEEDSYTIFEILNARGLDLQDHELLKNYIMRYLFPVEKRDDAKKIWEDIENDLGKNVQEFLRHYAIHRYNYNNDKKQGISIYKSIQNATKGRNINMLLDDIKLKSQYYKRIIEPKKENGYEYEIYSFLKSKKVVQFRPLLLSLIHKMEQEQITQEDYEKTLKFIYHFFVCFKIIGQENSNIISDTIYKHAYSIETDFSNKSLDICIDALRKKLPTLESFTNSFKNLGWSNHWSLYTDSKNKERCHLVLNLLEKYVSNRDINIPVTIEHILPDSDSVENAQIGNLFLLEENLNRRCGNKNLKEKINVYKESSLASPRGFVDRYSDKEFNPFNRTQFLAKFVYNNILDVSIL